MNPVPIVLNPTAGGGRLLRHRHALDTVARANGVDLRWTLTQERGHGEELARRAAADGHRLVLAYGGDGTYNEVARGLAGTTATMGVLPGGTTSVLAYEFEVPRPAPRGLDALLQGHDRTMRVGRTNRGDLFLMMLSAGPDAVVVRNLADRFKWRGGRIAVAAQAVRELLGGGSLPRLMATVDDHGIEGGWAIVGNARCYGGPYHATPGADPFVDTLEVVVQRRVGRRAAIPFALGIPLGLHVKRRDVARFDGRRVLLEPTPNNADVPYQVDGDAVGQLPVEAWVADETVTVRLPKGSPWSQQFT